MRVKCLQADNLNKTEIKEIEYQTIQLVEHSYIVSNENDKG